jgi:hypothetical protein
MSQKNTSSGVVHQMPADLKKALTSDPKVLTAWEDITPLARNEWICWIESARKAETRSRRIEWGCSSRTQLATKGRIPRHTGTGDLRTEKVMRMVARVFRWERVGDRST